MEVCCWNVSEVQIMDAGAEKLWITPAYWKPWKAHFIPYAKNPV
jgi:hypothetical protein